MTESHTFGTNLAHFFVISQSDTADLESSGVCQHPYAFAKNKQFTLKNKEEKTKQ